VSPNGAECGLTWSLAVPAVAGCGLMPPGIWVAGSLFSSSGFCSAPRNSRFISSSGGRNGSRMVRRSRIAS
jgi:hypothetical protein